MITTYDKSNRGYSEVGEWTCGSSNSYGNNPAESMPSGWYWCTNELGMDFAQCDALDCKHNEYDFPGVIDKERIK